MVWDRLIITVILLSGMSIASGQAKLPASFTDFDTSQLKELPISPHFGVCTHFERIYRGWSPDMLLMIRNMGVGSYREEVPWKEVEKVKGQYKVPDFYDKHIKHAIDLGIEPLIVLLYGNSLYENKVDPYAFANYANHVIEHFKGRVKYFEVFNEPNNFLFRKKYGGMWNGKGEEGEEYAKWLVKFAEFATIVTGKIKEKNPNVFLTGYSMVPPSTHRMFDFPDAWKNLDALAIHTYSKRVPPEMSTYGGDKINQRDGIQTAGDDNSFKSLISMYRQKLDDMGLGHVKIWVTEDGHSTFKPIKLGGQFRGYTPFAQASYNSRRAILALSYGVEKYYYYNFYDQNADTHHLVDNFGLVGHDYHLKPSFYAAQRLARLLNGKVQPVKIQVDIQRLCPWDTNDFTVYDEHTINFNSSPQIHGFKRSDGSTVVFIWRPGRIYADFQDELCNLTFENIEGSVLKFGSLVAGDEEAIKYTVSDGKIVVEQVPYSSDPFYIIIK